MIPRTIHRLVCERVASLDPPAAGTKADFTDDPDPTLVCVITAVVFWEKSDATTRIRMIPIWLLKLIPREAAKPLSSLNTVRTRLPLGNSPLGPSVGRKNVTETPDSGLWFSSSIRTAAPRLTGCRMLLIAPSPSTTLIRKGGALDC